MHVNDVLCYFGKRQSIVKLQLMKIYSTSFFMALYYGTWIILQLVLLCCMEKGFMEGLGCSILYT